MKKRKFVAPEFPFSYRDATKPATDKPLVIDCFAGGGGVSLGLEEHLGRPVDIAINHDPEAIRMHKINHPHTEHYIEDIFAVDPQEVTKGREVGLAWFSPDCTHHSKAKGGKPVSNKRRGLAWVVIRWAAKVKPRIIMLENVREFEEWGPLTKDNLPCKKRKGMTFKRWKTTLVNLGYQVEHRVLNCAQYSGERLQIKTIRRRLFLIARCDGKPIVWPEPTHDSPKSNYVQSGLRKPWHTAAECIDWSLKCPSIFERPKPLADKTLRRIALGIVRYVLNNPKPFLVRICHNACDGRASPADSPPNTVTTKNEHCVVDPFIVKANHGSEHFRGQPSEQPLSTITKVHGHALITPHISTYYGTNKESNEHRGSGADEPLRVQPTENRHGLVAATLTRDFGNSVGQEATEPLGTVMPGGGGKTGLVGVVVGTANTKSTGRGKNVDPADDPMKTLTTWSDKAVAVASIMQHYGGVVGKPIDVPLPAVTTVDHNSLLAGNVVKIRGDSQGTDVETPLPTITSGAGATRPAGAAHAMGLAAATLVHQNHGAKQCSGVDEPLRTVVASSTHACQVLAFLTKYAGTNLGGKLDDPVLTQTTHHRFGMVEVMIQGEPYIITDIGFRMLKPRELARAQGFPDDYVLVGSQASQVAAIGNSVPPWMATVLARANYVDELTPKRKGAKYGRMPLNTLNSDV